MSTTKIEYLTKSWNPVAMRCTPVSDGCANCWHLQMARRHAANPSLSPELREARGGGKPYLNERELLAPTKWRGRQQIGVQFMGDLFHEAVPFAFVDRAMAVAALCPQHTFMVLTKRPERMEKYFAHNGFASGYPGSFGPMRDRVDVLAMRIAVENNIRDEDGSYPPPATHKWPIHNLWLGTSIENQQTADERIPQLLRCPSAHRWVSAEPLLGQVDLVNGGHGWLNVTDLPDGRRTGIDWVVAGGETGRNARPMHPDWVRSLRDQCAAASVPFFFKSWGEWAEANQGNVDIGEDAFVELDGTDSTDWTIDKHSATTSHMIRVGKHAAGRLLDGVEHNEVPK